MTTDTTRHVAPSQTAILLRHFQEGGYITTWTAMSRFGIGRLSARIMELREKGHNVVTEYIETGHGSNKKRYAKYYLKK